MNEVAEIQKFVIRKTQNVIPETKAAAILERLKLEYPGRSFAQMLEALEIFPTGPSWLRNLVTINETFFFRHPEHFDFLKEYCSKKVFSNGVDILCGGASHGQEPYSIAMLLTEVLPQQTALKISAIDIDEEAIEQAKKGRYTEMELGRTPGTYKALLQRHLRVEETPSGKWYNVVPQVTGKVSFICGNIFQSSLVRYDVIFLRNILIYFQNEERLRLLMKLRDRLKPGGLLFIGAGELFPAGFENETSERSRAILERKVA